MEVHVEKARTYARQRAENTYEAPSTIINKSLENVSQATFGHLPNRQAMHKGIRRKRSIEDLQLPKECKAYNPRSETKGKFCLVDQEINHERMIIFGRETWLEHLPTLTIWYVDRRFVIAP